MSLRGPYFGYWENYKRMLADWGNTADDIVPQKENVLFASYGGDGYEWRALVLFTHNGKLYEVNGWHCSCFGLREVGSGTDTVSQWCPEETTWKALAMRRFTSEAFSPEAQRFFRSLVLSHRRS